MSTDNKTKELSMMDCTHAFAVPGESNIIDTINPFTNKSWINNESLDEIRLRYPAAEIVEIVQWQADKARRQDTPIIWDETTQEQYDEMLCVLPPAFWERGLFLVGEPSDHHATTGRARFQAYRSLHGKYLAASRPMTIGEARAIIAA